MTKTYQRDITDSHRQGAKLRLSERKAGFESTDYCVSLRRPRLEEISPAARPSNEESNGQNSQVLDMV
jgi:hypothetical protein